MATSSGPQNTTIWAREGSKWLTQLRRLCGQASMGPSGVAAQSLARIRAPSSPPPTSQSAAMGRFVLVGSTKTPRITGRSRLLKCRSYSGCSRWTSQSCADTLGGMKHIPVLALFLLVHAAAAAADVKSPAEIYGELFERVQLDHVYPDS